MFGSFQNQQGVGPMADIQSQVAQVLNGNGRNPVVYISAGPTEPIFQAPNPQIVIPLIPFLRRMFRR